MGSKTTVRVLNHNFSKSYATNGHARHGLMKHAPDEETGPVLVGHPMHPSPGLSYLSAVPRPPPALLVSAAFHQSLHAALMHGLANWHWWGLPQSYGGRESVLQFLRGDSKPASCFPAGAQRHTSHEPDFDDSPSQPAA